MPRDVFRPGFVRSVSRVPVSRVLSYLGERLGRRDVPGPAGEPPPGGGVANEDVLSMHLGGANHLIKAERGPTAHNSERSSKAFAVRGSHIFPTSWATPARPRSSVPRTRWI